MDSLPYLPKQRAILGCQLRMIAQNNVSLVNKTVETNDVSNNAWRSIVSANFPTFLLDEWTKFTHISKLFQLVLFIESLIHRDFPNFLLSNPSTYESYRNFEGSILVNNASRHFSLFKSVNREETRNYNYTSDDEFFSFEFFYFFFFLINSIKRCASFRTSITIVWHQIPIVDITM